MGGFLQTFAATACRQCALWSTQTQKYKTNTKRIQDKYKDKYKTNTRQTQDKYQDKYKTNTGKTQDKYKERQNLT